MQAPILFFTWANANTRPFRHWMEYEAESNTFKFLYITDVIVLVAVNFVMPVALYWQVSFEENDQTRSP